MFNPWQQTQLGSSQASISLDPLFAQIPFYQDVLRLRHDVINLLQGQRSLRPGVNTFRDANNNQLTLFYLHGTVGIAYRANTYNIPMTIYFDPPYPAQPPRCFVCPTADMQIKPHHKHVDSKGMVYSPYLNQWGPHSNCIDLLREISHIFSTDPPVFSSPGARPVQQEAQRASASQPVRGTVVSPAKVVSPAVSSGPKSSPAHLSLTKSVTANARSRVGAILQSLVDEINAEHDKQEALRVHRTEVETMISSIDEERNKIDRFNQLLDEAERKTLAFISEHDGCADDIDVVKFLEPHDVLCKQIIDLIAEENALEDYLLCLEDMLRSSLISPDNFLHAVRETSRKVFTSRELRNKVIQTLRARQLPVIT